MKIRRLSVRGSNPWNEDAWVVREKEQIYGVIDGATSLVPFRSPSGETGGLLASRLIANFLEQYDFQLAPHPHPASAPDAGPSMPAGGASLAAALLAANTALHDEMEKHGIDPSDKEAVWGACALVVHIRPTAIDFVQAGDCMLVAQYQDNSFRVITRDQLAYVDEQTEQKWAEGIQRGIKDKEALWDYVKPQIVSGRRLMNTPNGYAVLNGDPKLADHLEWGTINRMNLRALLLMTDGLYLPHEAHQPSFGADDVAKRIAKMGLEGYVEWLTQLEANDPDCVRYPRVKPSDDKTAIWIEFTH